MKGSELRRLSDVTAMARVSATTGYLTLHPVEGGATVASFGNVYVSCAVVIPAVAVDRPVTVLAREFKQLAALFFTEEEVRVSAAAARLTISAGKRRASLALVEEKPQQYPSFASRGGVTIDRTAFQRAIGIASLAVAKEYTNPILTGIRLVSNQGAVGVQATNGIQMYEAMLKPSEAVENFRGAVASYDLIAACGLVRGQEITVLAQDERSLYIIGGDAVVKMPLLNGDWPNLSGVRTRPYLDPFLIPTKMLAAAAKAIGIYRAQPFLVFLPEEGGIGLETIDEEEGTFRDEVPGRIKERYIVGVAEIQTAARLDADEVVIHPSADGRVLKIAPNQPRVEGTTENMYILTRV